MVSRVTTVINIEPGSMSGSIFSLVAACMGAGTLTMPYIISKTGIILGPVLILLGALLSYYAGMLIIKCTEITGKKTYEDFATQAFGKKFSILVSVFVLISLVGFATAYVALAKTLIPTALASAFGHENLPYYLQNNEQGEFVCVTFFVIFIFFPLSLPQNLSTLRFSSALGVICTGILCYVIIYQFFYNKLLVPVPYNNFEKSKKADFDFDTIVEAVPYITFLYLFQPNVP